MLTATEILLDAPLMTLPNGRVLATHRNPALAELLAAAMVVETDEDGDLVTRYNVTESDVPAWLVALDGVYDGLFELDAEDGETELETLRVILHYKAGHELLQLVGRALTPTQVAAAHKLRSMPREAAVAQLERRFNVEGGRGCTLGEAILPPLYGDNGDAISLHLMIKSRELDTNALDSDRYQGQVRSRTASKRGPAADVAFVEGLI
jgi:hypothetical protein